MIMKRVKVLDCLDIKDFLFDIFVWFATPYPKAVPSTHVTWIFFIWAGFSESFLTWKEREKVGCKTDSGGGGAGEHDFLSAVVHLVAGEQLAPHLEREFSTMRKVRLSHSLFIMKNNAFSLDSFISFSSWPIKTSPGRDWQGAQQARQLWQDGGPALISSTWRKLSCQVVRHQSWYIRMVPPVVKEESVHKMKSPGEALHSSREKACLPMASEGGPDIRFSLTYCFVKNVEPVIDVQG